VAGVDLPTPAEQRPALAVVVAGELVKPIKAPKQLLVP